MSRIRVYCAVSLDGFIAGPDDDLSWLGEPDPEEVGDPGTVGFPAFMEQTGAMLMGRRTFDTVVPVLLGQGVPLYRERQLQRTNAEYLGRLGEMMQMKMTKAAQLAS